MARDVLRGTLGPLADELPKALDDHPSSGRGSAFNGIARYGYVVQDLAGHSWHRHYCGGGDRAACAAQLRTSLAAAARRVLARQGTRPLDWQNRPTFQQVVRFRS